MKKLFLLLLFILPLESFGYANFIGHGYTSCLNCHFNPTGNGPLNDYGRAVSATLISGRALYPKTWTEEKLAEQSGFLFRKPKQDWLRTQINYRGFQVVRNPGSESNETKTWINMQFDGRAILKFGENDRFIMVGNYGYAPLPQNSPLKESEWRSREHYMGYRFTPKVGVYAGLMDKAYGIKVIKHIAYSRQIPRTQQNDQVHGVMLHYLGDQWETFLHGFAGNLTQDAEERMQGGSLMTERTIFDTHRIGASFLKQSNQLVDQFSYSGHGRFNLKDGSAILAELGQRTQKTENGSQDTTARFGLLQTYIRPTRGLYFLANIEYLQRDIEKDNSEMRWGPAVQYFPVQRLEFRLDVYNTRTFAPKTTSEDTWMYLFQTHVWL